MILYFSGTGNSEYAAKRIGKEIGDEVTNLFERIRNHDFSAMRSDRPWVIVSPTYAWRIPRIVQEWLENTRQRYLLSGVCPCKEVLRSGLLYLLRKMCGYMSAGEYPYG